MVEEIRALSRLAIPLILAQLGLMTMVLADTYMVGRLGSVELAGMGLGNAFLFTLSTLIAGLVMGLDGLFAKENAKGGVRAAAPWFFGAGVLVIGASLLSVLILYVAGSLLESWGVAPEVARVASSYLRAVSWCILPGILFLLARQFLAALGVVRKIAVIVLLANGVNIALNYLWIPKWGAAGSGYATTATRFFMVGVLIPDLLRILKGVPWQVRLKDLLKIGGPVSMQAMARAGVFSLLGVWVGKIGVTALAAHSIVLMVANLLNMIPIGLSSAVAIRVAIGLGRDDFPAASRSIQGGLWAGGGLMALLTVVLWIGKGKLIEPFAVDLSVREMAGGVLIWVALFQIVDTLQYVVVGALRAYHEFLSALWGTLFGLWGVTLIIAYGRDLSGVWAGVFSGIVTLFLVTGFTLWRRSYLPVPAAESFRSPGG